MATNIETNTDFSRILFIDSRNGINTSGDSQLTTKFEILLDEPIVVPQHHSIGMSLHRVNIAKTFYNFQFKRNCGLEVAFLSYDGTNSTGTGFSAPYTDRPPYLSFEIDEGNWDAISLMNKMLRRSNDYLHDGVCPEARQPHGVINLTDDNREAKYKISMIYNRSTLKYEWALDLDDDNKNEDGSPITDYGGLMMVFRWRTGELFGSDLPTTSEYKDTSMRQEVGFITNKWVNGTTQDFILQYTPATLPADRVWEYGYGSMPTTYPMVFGGWARYE